MAVSFDENLENKLQQVANTQDSIQSFSFWIQHHRIHHKKIANTWINILKQSKTSHRLTLIYLANDVIQNSRKKSPQFLDSFQEVMKDAATLVSDEKIKKNVERVFNIWGERNVYDVTFIDSLKKALVTNEKEDAKTQIMKEFDIQKLKDQINTIEITQKELNTLLTTLTSIKADVTAAKLIKKFKDKSHGLTCSKEYDNNAVKVEEYIKKIEVLKTARANIIDHLEKAMTYYLLQSGEVKVVANAYKNFSNRISQQHSKLQKLKGKFSPVPSPPIDAPSPTNSDEGPILDPNIEPKDVPSSWMGSFLSSTNNKQNIFSNSGNSNNTSSSLDSRLSNLINRIDDTSPLPSSLFSKNINVPQSRPLLDLPNASSNPLAAIDIGSTTPLKDENTGRDTPVQDEEFSSPQPSANFLSTPDHLSALTALIAQPPPAPPPLNDNPVINQILESISKGSKALSDKQHHQWPLLTNNITVYSNDSPNSQTIHNSNTQLYPPPAPVDNTESMDMEVDGSLEVLAREPSPKRSNLVTLTEGDSSIQSPYSSTGSNWNMSRNDGGNSNASTYYSSSPILGDVDYRVDQNGSQGLNYHHPIVKDLAAPPPWQQPPPTSWNEESSLPLPPPFNASPFTSMPPPPPPNIVPSAIAAPPPPPVSNNQWTSHQYNVDNSPDNSWSHNNWGPSIHQGSGPPPPPQQQSQSDPNFNSNEPRFFNNRGGGGGHYSSRWRGGDGGSRSRPFHRRGGFRPPRRAYQANY